MDDTTVDLDAILARHSELVQYEESTWIRGVTAERSAADIPALLAEVDRLRDLAYSDSGEPFRDRFRAQMQAAGELIEQLAHAESSRELQRERARLAELERDALAAEVDGEWTRHEFEPCNSPREIHIGPPGHCGKCGTVADHRWHRTSRVVLAEQAGK